MEATNKKPLVLDPNEEAVVKAPNDSPELIDEIILNKNGDNISITTITDLNNEYTTNEVALGIPDVSGFETKEDHAADISRIDGELAGKQPTGDYETKAEHTDDLTTNYYTKSEVDSKDSEVYTNAIITARSYLTAENLFPLFEAGDGITIELNGDTIKIGVV